MTDSVAGGAPVWALLIERGVDEGSDLRLFWQRSDAEAAAQEYLAETWWDDEPSLPSGLAEVIERYNADPNAGAKLFLGAMAIEGERARCQLCGEPIVLDDEDDSNSWVHAEDANDGADHTAEFRSGPSQPTGRDIA